MQQGYNLDRESLIKKSGDTTSPDFPLASNSFILSAHNP